MADKAKKPQVKEEPQVDEEPRKSGSMTLDDCLKLGLDPAPYGLKAE